MEDSITGFIADPDNGEVYGRPEGVVMNNDGALLVADDLSSVIWKFQLNNQK